MPACGHYILERQKIGVWPFRRSVVTIREYNGKGELISEQTGYESAFKKEYGIKEDRMSAYIYWSVVAASILLVQMFIWGLL